LGARRSAGKKKNQHPSEKHEKSHGRTLPSVRIKTGSNIQRACWQARSTVSVVITVPPSHMTVSLPGAQVHAAFLNCGQSLERSQRPHRTKS
jgi:hypothetical protein